MGSINVKIEIAYLTMISSNFNRLIKSFKSIDGFAKILEISNVNTLFLNEIL